MANQNQNIPSTTIARDLRKFEKNTHNVYESIAVISKRANQIAAKIKDELHQKLQEFDNDSDTLEEVFENREQIEISMQYERMPKPTLVATEEFLNDKVYHKNPVKEQRLAEGGSL